LEKTLNPGQGQAAGKRTCPHVMKLSSAKKQGNIPQYGDVKVVEYSTLCYILKIQSGGFFSGPKQQVNG
jgi:hypothetical protein